MEDEIILSGKFKDFDAHLKFGLKEGTDELEVAKILEFLRRKIDPIAYKFEEIDIAKIESFGESDRANGKGLERVIGFLESNPPGKIKSALLSSTKNPKLYDVAESYLLNYLLRTASVPYHPVLPEPSLKPVKEDLGPQVAFIGHYKSWMVIKKLSLANVEEDWEVCAILSGIHQTIINKSFEFAGFKEPDKNTIKKLGGGKRKSLGNLLSALKTFSKEIGEVKTTGHAFLLKSLFESIGYRPYPNLHILLPAHPEVKIPKPRGRLPK